MLLLPYVWKTEETFIGFVSHFNVIATTPPVNLQQESVSIISEYKDTVLVEGRWNAAKYFDLFMSLPSLFGVLLGRGSDGVEGGRKLRK